MPEDRRGGSGAASSRPSSGDARDPCLTGLRRGSGGLDFLSRKRALTLPMIRRLSEELQIGADVLIRESPPRRRRNRERPKA